ncbi:MAG: pseudouridine synthase [Eubacteriales bacterium]|nr:pseudouridine synthase [Clostridiales bacterium]MDD2441355.1 pseudouridine synthase [Eubacteriales bacterium]MDD4139390.1 pseudouridine synthase [Eubacteriales bacterium]MDD4743513.1 pseudouridine synthase [Eubacteriales bacterium]
MTPDRPIGVRINKFLADSGRCSRREADQLVASGAVLIDGSVAQAGSRVLPGQTVTVSGEPVLQNADLVYLILYKPVGITCTTDTRRRDNIIDYLGYPQRVFPIGRLDRDSEGLIFLTNDGDIVNRILRAENHHEKEYRVTVDKPVTPEFLRQMASGVPILGTVTRPCRVTAESKYNFRIVLTQGLNRQIRRMCDVFGYDVKRLVRTRIMHIAIGSMKPGQWRPFTFHELSELKRLLGLSKS